MTLKTKQLLNRNCDTFQKTLSFLMHRKKNKAKKTRSRFMEFPTSSWRIRPFLYSSSLNQRILSANINVRIIKRVEACFVALIFNLFILSDPESFHRTIAPILILAQLIGIMPVSGICEPSPLKLKFTILSFRTIYAIFIITMVFFMAVLSVMYIIRTLTYEAYGGVQTEEELRNIAGNSVFYVSAVLELFFFLWLSPRWVTLQQNWRAMEQFINSNTMERPKLRCRLYTTIVSLLMLSLIEHTLSIVVDTIIYEWKVNSENATFSNFLKIYCEYSHPFVPKTVTYNTVIGLFTFVISHLSSFILHFSDSFIIMLSIGLAERYRILNKEVITSALTHPTTINWCKFREDYAMLNSMIKKVDSNVAPLILLSFGNKIYFICLILFNGLSPPGDNTILSNIYFFGNFIFLIGRLIITILLAAKINDESKVALPTLYNCSSSTYNLETERLIYQLTTDDVALTGMHLFRITRNFMLAIASAIITYEVILLQFNTNCLSE